MNVVRGERNDHQINLFLCGRIDSTNAAEADAEIKSITIRLHFVSPVKTLSKQEIQTYIDEILADLAKKNIVLRG